MKKRIFVVFFLLASVFAFSLDFSEIQNIQFGLNKESVIAIMEDKGYKAFFPASNMVSFTKPNETYLECNVKEYIFVFSSADNSLLYYTIVLYKNRTIYKDAPLYFTQKYKAEIADVTISNPIVNIFKIPFPDNSCIVLLDTNLTEYIIKFYNIDVWID